MQRPVVILDAIAGVFLILLSLNFLFLFGLQGAPALEQILSPIPAQWVEVVFFGVLAIVTGTMVHLIISYEQLGALACVAGLWMILTLGFVFGIMPIEVTVRSISWRLLAFSYPLIYLYLIWGHKVSGYFKACAWIYTLATLGLVARGLVSGGSALTGAAGLIPFILTAFFVSVSLYLAWRLLTVRSG